MTAPALLLEHRRQHHVRQRRQRDDVHLELLHLRLERVVQERAVGADARVVDQDVDVIATRLDRIEQLLALNRRR